MPTTGMGPMLKSFKKRDGGWPTIGDLWPDETQGPRIDTGEARWVWLGHPRWDTETPKVEATGTKRVAVDPVRIEADAELLDRRIEQAREYQARPWLGTASEEGHRLFREAMADRLDGEEDGMKTPRQSGAGQQVAIDCARARADHGRAIAQLERAIGQPFAAVPTVALVGSEEDR